MRTVVLGATLAALAWPLSGGAQTLPMTEAEALARLSPATPRVRALRAGVEVARADVPPAARWPNPRLTFDRESVAGVSENMTMVSQTLPITGRRGFEMDAVSALADAVAGRTDEALRRARADLRLAFVQLLSAQTREGELSEARDRLRGLADVLGRREAAGDAAGFDRLRAEREVLDLDADRAAAAVDRSRAQASLAGFFPAGADRAAIVAVAGTAAPPDLPPLAALVERAESTRGELAALRKEAEAAGFSQQAADRRSIPEPEVVAGTKSSTLGGGDVGTVFSIHVSLPLFDRSKPEKALADARARQAAARADAFRLALQTEIAGLRAAVAAQRENADRYRTAAVDIARQIERVAEVSYDAGERGILELLDAYRSGMTARLRQAALDAAVRQTEIELEFVSGWELSR